MEVWGTPGIDVWINIVGIGWYQLTEVSDGNFSTDIPAEDLDVDTEYSYFFSDREGGSQLESEMAGTVRTVAEPVVDDDDHLVGIITESDIFRVLIEWFDEDMAENEPLPEPPGQA